LAGAKLARTFREPHFYLGRELPLSVTAGFAPFKSGSNDMSIPMQQASIALRQAKSTSNLFEVYSPNTTSSAEEEQKLLKRVELGVERGEFQLYFQPKFHAGYRTLIGAEALLRWHPEGKKVVLPDKFIDLAERNEVIRPLTWWCIKSAIGRLAQWPEELSIAVNVTPALLIDDDVITVVREALDIYGVKASRLTLEVTEKIMVDNQVIMLRQLAKLRKIGVRIALDDFGTGYSSLAYFRDLSVDEIKIDRVFVVRMLESKKDLAIVKAVIDLAHNFSMKVVAEGVETMELADRLTEMRCDILQGYAFDKALLLEEFEKQYVLAPKR
jgi:EAL domain-containing protein (putative c-di-GMP-specific phosphodiesterase class I)